MDKKIQPTRSGVLTEGLLRDKYVLYAIVSKMENGHYRARSIVHNAVNATGVNPDEAMSSLIDIINGTPTLLGAYTTPAPTTSPLGLG